MKTDYMKFDSRSKEAFNTAQLGAVLARGQEYLLPLRFDSNGADVLAYNPATNSTRAIQVKSRATIDAKYRGRNLWMAFPHWVSVNQQDWYVVPHDTLADLLIGPMEPRLFRTRPKKPLIDRLANFRVGSVTLGFTPVEVQGCEPPDIPAFLRSFPTT
jgi:hypothetical protein